LVLSVNTARRKFTDTALTHSMAHHLVAVAQLLADRGYARVSDIARLLELTPGSVSVSMKGLCGSGYVDQDENRFFHLTSRGRRAVCSVRTRYEIMKRFLMDVLCLGEDDSHRQSCQIAYLLDAPSIRRLAGLLTHWELGDQGQAIAEAVPLGCPGCECAGDRSRCPCCGLECLSDWLPPLSSNPPCKESSHEN
jgi:Mn-dependent DtxR family transcriptional regulator